MAIFGKVDRVVIRAALSGQIEFDDALPNRFARIGNVRLYKPVVGSGKWAILFGHNEEDYGVDLGTAANMAMDIAAKYASATEAKQGAN